MIEGNATYSFKSDYRTVYLQQPLCGSCLSKDYLEKTHNQLITRFKQIDYFDKLNKFPD